MIMRDTFNDAASIGEDAPAWCEVPTFWGRSGIFSDDDEDASPGDAIESALENYAALMEGLNVMGAAWTDDFERELEHQRALKEQAETARREAFDLELEQASILQQPMRISRPVSLRRRLFN
jgi:hypothetical protein